MSEISTSSYKNEDTEKTVEEILHLAYLLSPVGDNTL